MAQFRYKAVDSGGNLVSERIEAESESAVLRTLSGKGLSPVLVARSDQSIWTKDIEWPGRAGKIVSGNSLKEFVSALAPLLSARVEVTTAVVLAANAVASKRAKAFFREQANRVRDGASLASALAADGARGVPAYVVSLVRAGETGACLDRIFVSLSESLEAESNRRERIRSALIYPAFLLVLAVLSVFFLSLFVIPRFEPLFVQAGGELPAITRFFKIMAEGLIDHWTVILGAIVVLVFVIRNLLSRPDVTMELHRHLVGAPVLGTLVYKSQCGRVLSVWALLMNGGVPAVSALRVAAGAASNNAIREAIGTIANSVEEGASLAAAFTSAKIFVEPLPHLVAIGEHAGGLSEMMEGLARQMSKDVEKRSERLLGLLTPAITLLLGLIVALIMTSLMAVVLDLNELVI